MGEKNVVDIGQPSRKATKTRTDRWLFDVDQKPKPQSTELAFGRVKAFLYESLHRSITRHNLQESFQLIKLLPKETTLDPYVLFRFILILIETNKTKSVNKNVIIYLESLMSKLNLVKPDVFVEFLSYFIRHNRIDDARELFAQRHRYMALKCHKQLPFVDLNLRCYEFLLNYSEWNERVSREETKLLFDVSIQGWIVNSIECLKTAQSNHEYFVMCLVKMLLYYGYFKKAYLFVSEFQRINPGNISAQLLHYYLLEKLDYSHVSIKKNHESSVEDIRMECDYSDEQRIQNRQAELVAINNFSFDMQQEAFESYKYPVNEERKSILKNLCILDPSREEIAQLESMHDNPIDILRDLMDGMEVLSEVKNILRWKRIQAILKSIISSNDEVLLIAAQFLWHTRYRRYWKTMDFVSLAEKQISTDEENMIVEVTSIISSILDKPIK